MPAQPEPTVPIPNTLRDAVSITEQLSDPRFTDAADALRIGPDGELVAERVEADGAIEPGDFNADEPVAERECPECDTVDIVITDADIAHAIATYDLRKDARATKAELVDVRLRLIAAELFAIGIPATDRRDIDEQIERVRELVREVAK